jgi:hypothetical protein
MMQRKWAQTGGHQPLIFACFMQFFFNANMTTHRHETHKYCVKIHSCQGCQPKRVVLHDSATIHNKGSHTV